MPESEKKILEEVDYFRDKYFTYDLPIPFNRLTLYPVSIKDYNEFLSSSACLTLNKNDDVAGIRMTNIDYLLSKMQDEKEGPMWSLRFTGVSFDLLSHIIYLSLKDNFPSGCSVPVKVSGLFINIFSNI